MLCWEPRARIRPKSEPAPAAWFPSALSLLDPFCHSDLQSLSPPGWPWSPVWAEDTPSSAIPSASLQHLQNSFPGHPSSLRAIIHPFLHPQNSQNTSFKPKPCCVSVPTEKAPLEKAPLKQPRASVSPPVTRLRKQHRWICFLLEKYFSGGVLVS